jgi:hypothetical protein
METEQIVETTVTETPEVTTPEPSLLQRVSSFKPEETKAPEENKPDTFNPNDIESIEDPQAKEYAQKAYKSLEKGYQKKFQDLAALRKEVEAMKQDSNTWTPERVNKLLNDPTFVQSAQQIAGLSQEAQDDYSALSEQERKEIASLKQELNMLKQNSTQAEIRAQDEHLKSTYANYDSSAVDTLTADLLAGKVQAGRGDLWKVIDYENAVQRAYELGRQDNRGGLEEKVNSSSATEGLNISQNANVQKKESGESSESYFSKLGQKALEKITKNR